MVRTTVIFLVLCACSGGKGTGATGAPASGTGTGSTTGTGTGTTTGTGTGTGTGAATGTGTGAAGLRDGSYTGPLDAMVTYEVPFGPAFVAQCTGTVDIEVVEAVSPQINGTATCDSGIGALGTLNLGIQGDITVDPAVSGTLVLTSTGVSSPWSGTFDADELSGVFELAGYALGGNIELDGDWLVAR